MTLWAAKWKQTNQLDGHREHLCLYPRSDTEWPKVFRTRRECREFIEQQYGYIRQRSDLQKEPHCWRVPTAVKVKIVEAA